MMYIYKDIIVAFHKTLKNIFKNMLILHFLAKYSKSDWVIWCISPQSTPMTNLSSLIQIWMMYYYIIVAFQKTLTWDFYAKVWVEKHVKIAFFHKRISIITALYDA